MLDHPRTTDQGRRTRTGDAPAFLQEGRRAGTDGTCGSRVRDRTDGSDFEHPQECEGTHALMKYPKVPIMSEGQWYQGDFAVTAEGNPCAASYPAAVRFCLLGWIEKHTWDPYYEIISDLDPIHEIVSDAFEAILKCKDLSVWNDRPKRKFTEINTAIKTYNRKF